MIPFFQLFGLDHLESPLPTGSLSGASGTARPVHVTTVGMVRVSRTSTSSRVGQRRERREVPLKRLSKSRRSQDEIMDATSEQGRKRGTPVGMKNPHETGRKSW